MIVSGDFMDESIHPRYSTPVEPIKKHANDIISLLLRKYGEIKDNPRFDGMKYQDLINREESFFLGYILKSSR
jgi:hypothetical protein